MDQHTTENVDRALDRILDLWWLIDDEKNGVVVNRHAKKAAMRQIILAHLGLGDAVVNPQSTT